MHKVVRPFAYSVDGLTLVDLSVGDERDFGELAVGLLAEGWIEPAIASEAAAESQAEESVLVVAAEEPVAIEPRSVRKRK